MSSYSPTKSFPNLNPTAIVLLTTVIGFTAMYLPQPILPLLSAELKADPSQVSLLISATLLPLALAPVLYGYLLEAWPAKTLLRLACALLALSEIPFFFSDSLPLLIVTRFVQGLILPAIFTSAITYVSSAAAPENVRKATGQYIAATILGGFTGRALSGWIASHYSWRLTFALIAVALIVMFFLLGRLENKGKAEFSKVDPAAAKRILADGFFRRAYWFIFLVFSVFASVLNMLPFRLSELNSDITPGFISLAYTGYLIGGVMALNVSKISDLLGGERRTLLLALLAFATSVSILASIGVSGIFVTMWLLCASMFLMHALLSGLLNHRASGNRGVVNGLYISFYYAGGTLGSWLPVFAYRAFGWQAYCGLMLLLIGMAGVLFWRMRETAGAE